MDLFGPGRASNESDHCRGDDYVGTGTKETYVQLTISLGLGVSAFVAFCIIRPRWKSLYAARRRQMDPTIGLPSLPDTFFGWIPVLYKVTDEQVLASAGLDAFVFLAFFKLSIKLFAILFFFAAVILAPINSKFAKEGGTHPDWDSDSLSQYLRQSPIVLPFDEGDGDGGEDNTWNPKMGYLWAYLVFTYFFSFLTLYFTDKETFRVIRVRQDYLGTQSTVTDRTFRLSGMPKALRSEAKIKDLIEKLEIGKVESVNLCKDWEELDGLVAQREATLRKLEETWSVYLGQGPPEADRRQQQRLSRSAAGSDEAGGEGDEEEAGENGQLIAGPSTRQLVERERPRTRIWYGPLRLRSKQIDAIDYYGEKLRRLDEKIVAARKKEYRPVDLAFVTMDSIAACQMATQALIDPRPGQLLTKMAPAPSDIVWRNTYIPHTARRVRSWLITIFITVLTVVWLVPVAALAGLVSICTIKKFWPALADSLESHDITKALVQTGLPTVVVSLLNIAVPYLYDYLSNQQGTISQGDVELSLVSKNFFFTFFNIFLVFNVFGTTASFWTVLRDSLRDTRYVAYQLARRIQGLSGFYLNFIMLQGIGLFPFRLLEFGSVTLYPISRMGAKTPRDFAQIAAPPVFQYGFYLPTALLVFILCLVYSVLPRGYLVLLLGLVYFVLGYFTYKYQLLYAMDQPQHSTGGAWRIVCYRVLLGLFVFQVTMAGILALASAFFEAFLVVPLLGATAYYTLYWRAQFEPLTKNIALRSIRRDVDIAAGSAVFDEVDGSDGPGPGGPQTDLLRRGSTIDEDREKGLRFLNPSLVAPLQQPWIFQTPPPAPRPGGSDGGGGGDGDPGAAGNGSGAPSEQQSERGDTRSTPSSFSLGDTNVWRDAGDHNV